MNSATRRRELGLMLRLRRMALQPEDFGLPRGTRRRTPGLKREEVALLCEVSVSWYTWLEQGKEIQPSRAVLARIAKALRLSPPEWLYVSALTNSPGEESISSSGDALSSSTIQTALEAFERTPAVIYNNRFDVVAANSAAKVIYGSDVDSQTPWRSNMLWRFFLDPDRRHMYPDGLADEGVLNLVQALRMNWVTAASGFGIEELIDELRTRSGEFDRIWRRGQVSKLGIVPGRMHVHRVSKEVEIQYTRFEIPAMPNYAVAAVVPIHKQGREMFDRCLEVGG